MGEGGGSSAREAKLGVYENRILSGVISSVSVILRLPRNVKTYSEKGYPGSWRMTIGKSPLSGLTAKRD